MRKIETLALAASLSVAGAFAANAALLDFTDLDTFTGPNAIIADASGAKGYLKDSVTWTLTPSTEPMRYNFGPGNGDLSGTNNGFDGVAKPAAALAFEGDGIGIIDDETSNRGREYLTLSFSKAVEVTAFHFLDLFFGTPENKNKVGYEAVSVFDTVTNLLIAEFTSDQFLDANAIGGYKFGSLTTPWVGTSLTFRTSGSRDDADIDFALAAVDVAPVPVPAAGLLLLTAVGGLAVARRRKA
jgi:hypothetical protein